MKTIIDSKLTIEKSREIAIRSLHIALVSGFTLTQSEVELFSQSDMSHETYLEILEIAKVRKLEKVTY